MTATVRRWDDTPDPTGFDLPLAGPGPGDPRDLRDPRIARLRELVQQRLDSGRPLLAVCLSHQILAGLLGLPVVPLAAPYQGTQRRIDLFGREVNVGYYNTYTATSIDLAGLRGRTGLQVAADPGTGEVHALRGPGFASVQFHLESLLSTDGVGILADLTVALLNP